MIDGTTQPGYLSSPLVDIEGGGCACDGLDVGPPGLSTIEGIVVAGFGGDGIKVDGSGSVIGPGDTVTNNLGNGIELDAAGNQVTGNSIHDNGGLGLTAPVGSPVPPVLTSTSPRSGSVTAASGTLTGLPGTPVRVEFFDSPSCDSSGSGEGGVYLGSTTVMLDASGTGSFAVATLSPAVGDVITATATATPLAAPFASTSPFSSCAPVVDAGPDNTAWTRAQTISLDGNGNGSASGSLELSGQARWYKVQVTPGGTLQADLGSLPANYDLTVFTDLDQAATTISSQQGLQTLAAETPGEAFSPSIFSPSIFSPSIFSPSIFSPSIFSPSIFSPSIFSPSIFSPSIFSPSIFSPSIFSPSIFSPSIFSPSIDSPSIFSPADYENAEARSVLAVSANDGTSPEHVFQDVWNNTGSFYIRVNGRNGAYSPGHSFSLSVHADAGTCTGVSTSTALLVAPGFTIPTGVDSVIVSDPSRMTDDGTLATMESDLQTFAGEPSVNGAILDVGSISTRVEALQTQADKHSDCVYAENLVAAAIRDVVNQVRTQNPGLKYVVVIGNDHVIPFFRYPDTAGVGSESGYVPPVLSSSASEASLASNDFLSEDAYGSTQVLTLNGLDLPVPDLPVGRLVETPTEIDGMLRAYMGLQDGVVATPSSSLVTGYDFMASGAAQIESDLSAGLGAGATNDTLITNDGVAATDTGTPPLHSWTAAQLRTQLLGRRHDLIFLGAHFSANNLEAADFSTTLDSSELAASTVDLKNSIVFSQGCHSGYNIANGDAVPGVTQQVDWVEAFAQKQATLIAGTGYQYGDTDFLAYTEQLYTDFAQELRRGSGPVAVGQALTQAKAAYLDGTASVKGIDIKSLLEPTLYGLPMLSVDLPGERLPPSTTTSIASPAPVGVTVPPSAGQTLGLWSWDHTFTPALTARSKPLQTATGGAAPTATWLEGPAAGISTAPGAPALPLATYDVSSGDKVLRGVGFMGGTYTDQPGVTPLTGAPSTELNAIHSTFASTGFYPARPWSVNYFAGLDSNSSSATLMLTPAQYASDGSPAGTDIQRVYQSLGLRFFYSSNTGTYNGNTPALAGPPTLARIDATSSGAAVSFAAHVDGDPAAGIQEVWVTYTGVDPGQWESLDLTQDPTDSTLWSGTLSGLSSAQIAAMRFVVQAVNGVGLVSLDDNFGAGYQPGAIANARTSAVVKDPATLTLNAPPASGSYQSPLVVTATLTGPHGGAAGQNVRFAIGGAAVDAVTGSGGVATGTLTPGDLPGARYQLSASFQGSDTLAASSQTSPFTIDKVPTALAWSGPTSVPFGTAGGVGATLSGQGAGGQGVGLSGYVVAFVITPTGGTPGSPVIQTTTTGLGGLGSLAVATLAPGTYSVGVYFGSYPSAGLRDDPVFMNSSLVHSLAVAGQAPAISSAASASFTVAAAGAFTVTTTGAPRNAIADATLPGCTPSAPALPAGVTLVDNRDNTATLSGVPGAGTAGVYTLCLKAANGIGSGATQKFTLTIKQAPGITSAGAKTFGVGKAGTFAVTASGSPAPTLSETGPLPTGVTFHDNGGGTATLGGTAATSTGGIYTITITARNGVGANATQTFTLSVAEPRVVAAATTAPNTNGWYRANVVVHFTCTDPGSTIASGSCPPDQTITGEGAAVSSTTRTVVDAAGFTSPASNVVTVKIDKTLPAVTYSGNAGTYNLLATVSITCTASDALSGVASTTCANVSSPGWSLGAGPHALTATETDKAGNTGTGSTTFNVTVDAASLCALTGQFVAGSPSYQALKPSARPIVDALVQVDCAVLTSIGPRLLPAQKQAFINAYDQAVRALAQSHWLSFSQADTLVALAGVL